MRITSAASFSTSRRSSSRLPSPKYAAESNLARFCVKVAITSMPRVFASWRSSVSDASNSVSVTLDSCTAATMARAGFSWVSCIIPRIYQANPPPRSRFNSGVSSPPAAGRRKPLSRAGPQAETGAVKSSPTEKPMYFEILKQIVVHTPTWVYALFIALMGFGLSQLRTRTVNERMLAVAPLAMAAWSFYSVIAAFGTVTAGAVWAAGAAVALGIGLALKRPEGVRYVAQEKRFEIPGSWIPLALILAIFAVRYVFTAAMGFDPALRHSAAFIVAASLAYGLLGGLFPSRAVRFWKARAAA